MSNTKEVRKAKGMNPLTEGQTMKVLACKRYGGPEVYGVEDRPVPVLSEEKPDEKGGEVFICVHYSTVTATEAVFRCGDMMARLFTGLFRPKMQGGEFKAVIDRIVDAHNIVDTGRKRICSCA